MEPEPRLLTERCVLTPLSLADVDAHAAASGRLGFVVRGPGTAGSASR
jgi:hypothetical protein